MADDRYDDLNKVWDDRAHKTYGRFTDRPVRTILYAVGGIVAFCLALSLIGNATGIVSIYWQAEKAKLTVNPRVTQQVYSTGNALHNIAYFHDQCNTILADEQNVVNAQTQLKTDEATFHATTDPIAQQQAGTAVTQDQTTLTGTKDQLSNDVRDYDSKSATQTANPFKAANLPYRINISPATGEVEGTINCR